MNKTGIEWCDYTWNPVTGCMNGCPYCYAKKIAERFKGGKAFPNGFEPTFHPERLKDPHKLGKKWVCPESIAKGSTIFVCSMADLFGEWVPDSWINEVMLASKRANRHTYIFLTKNPKRYQTIPDSCFQSNFWFGTSVTCREDTHRIDTLQNRIGGDNKFISFEPLLGDPGPLDLTGIKQVIVGTQTNPTIVPPSEAIRSVVLAAANASAKVFFKDSMNGVPWRGQSTFVNVRDLWWDVHK
jgi:protein gp37